MNKILEISVIEAIKARAQLRAKNWIIKRESNGKTYIVHKPLTKPVADGLVNKAIDELDSYHYKKALEMHSESQKKKEGKRRNKSQSGRIH